MPSDEKNITLRDVANHAGVSIATASMGLRNNPEIAASTRARLREAAKELGYRPDPILAALVARRGQRRALANLAVIIDDCWTDDRAGEDNSWLKLCLSGMHKAAALYGYALNEVLLEKHLHNWKQPDRILKARGTRGLIVLPFRNETAKLPKMDWKYYSLVGVGVGDPAYVEQWHRVAVDAYSSMHLICKQLKARGVRRIGLAQQRHLLQRHRFEWLGGLSKEWHLPHDRKLEYVRPYLPDQIEQEDFTEWFLSERPEVVVTPQVKAINWIRSTGVRVPEDVGVSLITNIHSPEAAGIILNVDQIGEGAIDLMHSLILRGDTGIPSASRELLLRPQWTEGPTLRGPLKSTPAP